MMFLTADSDNAHGAMVAFIFLSFFIVFLVIALFGSTFRRRKFAKMTVVIAGMEYPNNHHVLGVGYYHAASQRWYRYPWNEYREDRGYFWEGTWNPVPDQRMVSRSTPSNTEIERVNQQWRDADPDRSSQFWDTVEREGFGTAMRRSEGS